MRPSYLSINLSSIAHNLRIIKDFVHPAKVMAVVKANAYGHGLVTTAKFMEACGADAFGVAFVEEAIEMREAGIKAPILTLGGIAGRQIELYLDYEIDILASSVSKLEAIALTAKQKNKVARIHLKIDTGMERTGVHHYSPALGELVSKALTLEHIKLVGISSHFADSESEDRTFMNEQLKHFNECLKDYLKDLPKDIVLHIANSGGLLSSKETHLGMVRPGRILYGISPADHLSNILDLQPCLSLKSEVVYFKVVRKGSTVSYGRTWKAPEDTRVVTIPLGYGDGLPRRYGNKGDVFIRGKRYPIVGTICMDQFMVDLGTDGEAYNGDSVTVIGSDSSESCSVIDMAKTIAAEPLEILTALSNRLPRQYIL